MQKVIDKTTVLVYNIYVAISEDVTGIYADVSKWS